MPTIVEASRMLFSAPEDDIAKMYDGDALGECIREWLETPEGTMAHYPAWGHNLTPFKHDPLSSDGKLEASIEIAITRKLPIDVEELKLVGVKIEILDFDLLKLSILHQFGTETQELKLKEL